MNGQNPSLGRKFDLLMVFLVIISVVLMILETMPELASLQRIFLRLELAFVVIFIVEYVVRVLVSRPRRAYIFGFYGIIDLLAILPALLLPAASGVRVVRLLRVFRLIRLFKLSRYSSAIRLFQVALRDIIEELVLFLVFPIMVVLALAFGIYHFENPVQPEYFRSVPASLWWAIVSLTSVGYGDAYPITTGGKIFTSFMLLVGMGVVSVPSALLATALSKAAQERRSPNESSLQ
ncbi:MAG: ion transporter [Anaerolineaceae bacterium]|nr:ion transporter [Anaerolineaceae bacterium]